MENILNLKNKNISLDKNISQSYLNPDFVYIEIPNGYKLNKTINSSVYKNDVILTKNNKKIYSPISGVISGIKKVKGSTGEINSLIIKNDFKEREKELTSAIKNITNYTKKDALTLIEKYYKEVSFEENDTLLVTALDIDPYEINLKFLLEKYTSEILETVDAILNIFNQKKAIILVPSEDNNLSEKIMNLIGTYNNIEIKLINNKYPISNKDVLYSKFDFDDSHNFKTVEEIYNIFNVLKRKKPLAEKIITFKYIKHNINLILEVKQGTLIKDIIDLLTNKIPEGNDIIINGLIDGRYIDPEITVITNKINSIFIAKPIPEEEDDQLYCPLGCDPNFNFKYNDKVKCGICEGNLTDIEKLKDNPLKKKVYIKKEVSPKILNIKYFYLHILLILFGFYKNGIKVFDGSLYTLLKPLILLIIPILISIGIHYVKNKELENYLNTNYLLYSLIIASVVSANINMILYSLVILMSYLIYEYTPYKINYPSLSLSIMIMITNIFSKYTLVNKVFENKEFNFTIKNYILSNNFNGNFTALTILVIFIMIYLYNSDFYKRKIAVNSLLIYITLITLISIFTNFNNYYEYIFSYNMLYGFILISTINTNSPYTKEGQTIYAVLLGTLNAILIHFIPNLSIFITILILSVFNDKFNNIQLKKTKNTQ